MNVLETERPRVDAGDESRFQEFVALAASPGALAVATNLLPTASVSTKSARVGVEFVSNV